MTTDVLKSINKYVSTTNLLNDAYKSLIISLYIEYHKDNANKEIISILSKDASDLRIYLSDNEVSILLEDYKSVILSCCDVYNQSVIGDRAIHTQPQELSIFLTSLEKIPEGSNIYLPFAGLATEVDYLPAGCNIFGSEINPESWALCQIRLEALNVKADIKLKDSFEEIKKDKTKANYVIMNPPYGLKGKGVLREWETIEEIIKNKLYDNGFIIAALNSEVLYNSNPEKSIRQGLIDRHYIKAAIQLPSLLSNISSIQISVVKICKESSDNILMIDGSSFSSISRAHRKKTLKVDSLLEEMSLCLKDSEYCRVIHASDIEDSILSPQRYIIVLPSIKGNYYKISEIVKFVDTDLKKEEDIYGLETIKIKNLSDDPTYIIKESSLEDLNIKHTYILRQNALAIQIIDGKVKIGTIQVDTNPEIIETESLTYFIRLEDNTSTKITIDLDYFKWIILSDVISYQISRLSYGTTTHIKKNDFLKLLIPVPDIEEQKKYINEQIHKVYSDLTIKMEQQFKDYQKDIHLKKHATGQIISRINSAWDVLRMEINNNEGIIDTKSIYDSKSGQTIENLLSDIENLIDKLGSNIDNFTMNENQIYNIEEIDIISFIDKYINNNRDSRFTYEFQKQIEYFSGDYSKNNIPIKYKRVIIYFPPKALSRILDNIVSNAIEYGFKNRTNNYIHFSYEIKANSVVIYVENNGWPLANGLKNDDILRYGETTSSTMSKHSGLGGYDIASLMNKYGKGVKVLSNPTFEFPVTYRLEFKLNKYDK